ncbi:MAG: diacylglycerol kinase family lipid kinase [Betaproteobacteria bacterium]|nr:MAG: diacylglycerol kinase family lipid kinase [Betaproteobacteria bacterium]
MRAIPLVLNSRSGGAGDDLLERLAGLYRAAGAELIPHVPKSGGEIVRLAREAARERPPLVVAAGGDGTVNAVASALVGSGIALGVVPTGTLNHFARDLAIPLDAPAAVLATLEGEPREIDVGEVNGRIFLNNSSIGLYPAMVHERTKQQRRLGRSKWHAMLWAAHTVLRSHPFMQLTLELDGKTYRRRTPFVFIGNNVYEMQGFDIGRRQRLDAGVLSVYVTHRGGRFGLLALAGRALLGRLEQSRDFEAGTAAELRIESRHTRLLVATDGEVAAMDLPLTYRVRPRALRVIAP